MVLGNQYRPLASKLCSHNLNARIYVCLNTVGAKLARDAGDAVFPDYRVDAIASKLCSHSVEPNTGVGLNTVGAKLARDEASEHHTRPERTRIYG